MSRSLAVSAFLLVALLTAVPAAFAATVQVQQVNNTFSPADITINVGDTVEWVWTSGFHTVTSGTGAADPQSGALFDSPLAGSNFSYTFNSAGDFDYYCQPHEFLGMVGIVRVQAPAAIPTLSSWGLMLLVAAMLATGLMVVRRRAPVA